jgi:hypothetical protein
MARWYDPRSLLETAQHVLVSTAFARNDDRRLSDAAHTGGHPVFDYSTVHGGRSAPREELVLDYVADTGDGWNSTYAVAYWVSRATLDLVDPSAKAHPTRRGDLLVFGGDEVYPFASAQGYEERLVVPYQAALEWTDPPHPALFAIPGNHDWYDNLTAFAERFFGRQWLGGWQTLQERSYFALKLPHRWWLVGCDVQLDSELDQRQVDFFREVAKGMGPEDRVILCTAEPHWVYAEELDESSKYQRAARNVDFLESPLVFGDRVKVWLAGDLHHYRRYALRDDSRQKITAGGGGAFLHPTHAMRSEDLPSGFERKTTFPDEKTSRRIGWRTLLFPALNGSFGALTAGLWVILYVAVAESLATTPPAPLASMVWGLALALPTLPLALAVVLAVVLGFAVFTRTSSPRYRVLAGALHGAVHVALPAVAACALRLAMAEWSRVASLWLGGLAMAVAGFALGPVVMGLYLCLSLQRFRRHRNEAFSAIRCEDYKSFLRLRIDEHGELTIFPVGLERVPREDEWVDDPAAASSRYVAKVHPRPGGSWTPPRLIEPPIKVR